MMISSRGRYALRVMIDLAEHIDEGKIPMKVVAERQNISLKYLERILPVLVKHNFIAGVHGKNGGYTLTKSPEECVVGDILRLTEGSEEPVSCTECDATKCEQAEFCRTKPMWDKLNVMINDYFDNITISDLMKCKK